VRSGSAAAGASAGVGPVHAEQVDQSGIDAAQAQRGVGDDREDGDKRGAYGERRLGILDEDDDDGAIATMGVTCSSTA